MDNAQNLENDNIPQSEVFVPSQSTDPLNLRALNQVQQEQAKEEPPPDITSAGQIAGMHRAERDKHIVDTPSKSELIQDAKEEGLRYLTKRQQTRSDETVLPVQNITYFVNAYLEGYSSYTDTPGGTHFPDDETRKIQIRARDDKAEDYQNNTTLLQPLVTYKALIRAQEEISLDPKLGLSYFQELHCYVQVYTRHYLGHKPDKQRKEAGAYSPSPFQQPRYTTNE